MAEEALAFAAAAVRAVVGHVLGDDGDEADLLGIAVVVVEREEPVAWLHVVRHLLLYRGLLHRPTSTVCYIFCCILFFFSLWF